MNYIWASTTRKKRVHIQAYARDGSPLRDRDGKWIPICNTRLPFNRAINAPFSLGRPVCKRCQAALS